MRYAIRAVKYFVYVSILATLFIAILVAAGFVQSDIDLIFEQGWLSIAKILAAFAAVSAFYPLFGYTSRKALMPGEYKEVKEVAIEAMQDRGYVLEREQDENMTFRMQSGFGKMRRMLEDRITLKRDYSGFYVEGLTKDVTRLVYALESKAAAAADRAE